MTMPGHQAIVAVYVVVLVAVCLATKSSTSTSTESSFTSKSFTISTAMLINTTDGHHQQSRMTTTSTKSADTAKSPDTLRSPKVLAAVESGLLHMLGLKTRPRPRPTSDSAAAAAAQPTEQRVPEYMMQLYRSQVKQRRHRPHANTIRSYSHQESPHDSRFAPSKFRFRFNVSSLPDTDIVRAAELRLHRRRVSSSNSIAEESGVRPLQRILVYDILRPATATDDAIVRLIDSRQLDAQAEDVWETLDVYPAVVRWQQEPRTNHGLYVHVTSASRNSSSRQVHVRLRRSTSSSPSEDSKKPLLVVHSDDPKAATSSSSSSSSSSTSTSTTTTTRHKRRSASKGRRKAARDNCRRHQLYVDFSDVGWNDWIVAPPGYQAYYCHGECNFPLADHLNSTNHAIVQTLMHSVKPHAVPRVCCVPTQLSSISMLYLDEYDKVVLKNYQDMVVQGCGCR